MKSPSSGGTAGMTFTGFDGAVRMQDREQYMKHEHCPKCGGQAVRKPGDIDECRSCARPLRFIPVGEEGNGFYVLKQPTPLPQAFAGAQPPKRAPRVPRGA